VDWVRIVIGVLAGFALVYAVMLLLLWRTWRHQPDTNVLRASLRLVPDLVVLLKRLASDPAVPRGVRVRMALLAAYLVLPLDLVPDFIPVLGYADDAIIVAIALRSLIRHAGTDALTRNWPGTPEGLRIVLRIAGEPRTD
jgi:uncharacterized membrane protein YkvA (DUF1232 family)